MNGPGATAANGYQNGIDDDGNGQSKLNLWGLAGLYAGWVQAIAQEHACVCYLFVALQGSPLEQAATFRMQSACPTWAGACQLHHKRGCRAMLGEHSSLGCAVLRPLQRQCLGAQPC